MPRSGSPRSDVGILSERLHEMLLKDQKKARAPPGMAKCPACGAFFSPTKNGRIRKHLSDPYERIVCDASGTVLRT